MLEDEEGVKAAVLKLRDLEAKAGIWILFQDLVSPEDADAHV